MNEMIFSWAEDANGKMVHVDSVPRGLNCGCTCPCCHEQLQARHGEIRAHGFAHHSKERGANLRICYMVIMYKLAEQIIQQEKKVHVPSYYGIFKDKDIIFSEVIVDDRYDRIDKQPDVIATTPSGEQYLIEFTFDYKVQHKKMDYQNLNCIEIDLSSQTLETLRDFILHSNEDKKWLNNQLNFEQIEELYSKRGKQVKIINESDCIKCELNTNCCGIRLKGHSSPISIENSGKSYRVCKIEEFDRAKKQFEKSKRNVSDWKFFSGQRIFPVDGGICRSTVLSLQNIKLYQLLRAILPEVLIDYFDIDRFEKSDTRFDIWLDEKKEQLRDDKYNNNIISYGFGDYRTIQDYPIRGRATYLHVRKRKWLDKATGEIFSYEWDVSEINGTRLNAEFVAFLRERD